MEKLRKERTVVRGQFTKAANTLEGLLQNIKGKDIDIRNAYEWSKQKADELFRVDEAFKEYLFESEDEAVISTEMEQIETYKLRWFNITSEYKKLIKEIHDDIDSDVFRSISETGKATKRKFKLPKIELKKFDGNIKNWLGFWGQFKKINDDDNIDDDDKYQYLLQATSPRHFCTRLSRKLPPIGTKL